MDQKPKLAPYYLLAVALIGIADSFYLAHASYTGSSISCALLEGCNTVARSSFSRIFGTPLSYFGLIYYLYMAGLAAFLAYDPDSRGQRLGALVYAAIGVIFSIYSFYVQAFLIKAFCIYCLTSDVLTVILLGLAYWHFRSPRAMREGLQERGQ